MGEGEQWLDANSACTPLATTVNSRRACELVPLIRHWRAHLVHLHPHSSRRHLCSLTLPTHPHPPPASSSTSLSLFAMDARALAASSADFERTQAAARMAVTHQRPDATQDTYGAYPATATRAGLVAQPFYQDQNVVLSRPAHLRDYQADSAAYPFRSQRPEELSVTEGRERMVWLSWREQQRVSQSVLALIQLRRAVCLCAVLLSWCGAAALPMCPRPHRSQRCQSWCSLARRSR